jgi:hypothetical protein
LILSFICQGAKAHGQQYTVMDTNVRPSTLHAAINSKIAICNLLAPSSPSSPRAEAPHSCLGLPQRPEDPSRTAGAAGVLQPGSRRSAPSRQSLERRLISPTPLRGRGPAAPSAASPPSTCPSAARQRESVGKPASRCMRTHSRLQSRYALPRISAAPPLQEALTRSNPGTSPYRPRCASGSGTSALPPRGTDRSTGPPVFCGAVSAALG